MAMQICKFAAVLVMLHGMARASQVEVVLAHYNEDLSWLSKIPEDVHIRIYTKGPRLNTQSVQGAVVQLPNVGRESHTYLKHIVENYERLSDWTVFTQAGEPSFGYKGHRSGGGHLLAGDDFANYLVPHPSGSRFVYTAVVHLPSMNHLLRAAYCIHDEHLEGKGVSTCPKEASLWTPWWDIGEFGKFVSSMVQSQDGEDIIDFYRKYINPTFTGNEVKAFFPQGARFAVSREIIQQRPKSDYDRLLVSLSKDEDPYAGYFMEWLWSELFLGHQEPCPVPAKLLPVGHNEAMNNLAQRFPKSVERQLSIARSLGSVSGAGCVCGGASAGISGGVSGGISGGISGSISGGLSGGISGGISGGVSGGISGSACTCGGVSGGISGGISGGVSTVVSATTLTTTTGSSGVAGGSTTSTSTSVSAATKSGTTHSIAEGSSTTTTTSLVVSNTVNRTNATIVAGVLEVEIDVQGTLSEEVVQDMFKRALAAALEVPVEFVVKLEASEIQKGSGSRRLQSIQTKWYVVSYEVIVPSDMDADAVVEKANRIALPGTPESQLLRDVLMATDGVERVGEIVAKVHAYKVNDEVTSPAPSTPSDQDKDEKSWKAVIIGAIAISVGVLCLVSSAVLIKRMFARSHTSTEKESPYATV